MTATADTWKCPECEMVWSDDPLPADEGPWCTGRMNSVIKHEPVKMIAMLPGATPRRTAIALEGTEANRRHHLKVLRARVAVLEEALGEAPHKIYPFTEGETVVLGPQVFMAADGSVLNLRGVNYVPQGDEHHTMEELYLYRMLYNAHAVNAWVRLGQYPVVKSWRHSDGELAFGGGWFIVVASLPTGQVSNHYKAESWGLFDVPEVEVPPHYDGHTPQEAAQRLFQALS